jgi:hypothetical protein
MNGDREQISFSVQPEACILLLGGALGVACAEELRQAALELCAYNKSVLLDWSGATQVDASIAQVLLALRAGLAEQNRSLACAGACAGACGGAIPPAIQNWLRIAGLADVLGASVPETQPGRTA